MDLPTRSSQIGEMKPDKLISNEHLTCIREMSNDLKRYTIWDVFSLLSNGVTSIKVRRNRWHDVQKK